MCDNPFSTILTLSHSLKLTITMINTVLVKQWTNNSFTTNNYSGTSTQHKITCLAAWKQTPNTNLMHMIYSRVEAAYNSQHDGKNIKWIHFIQLHQCTSNFLLCLLNDCFLTFNSYQCISIFLGITFDSLISPTIPINQDLRLYPAVQHPYKNESLLPLHH